MTTCWHDALTPGDFLIARNPEANSTLPYLLRIPRGERGIVLKSRDTWPRTRWSNPSPPWHPCPRRADQPGGLTTG